MGVIDRLFVGRSLLGKFKEQSTCVMLDADTEILWSSLLECKYKASP